MVKNKASRCPWSGPDYLGSRVQRCRETDGGFYLACLFEELIYKEVLDWEERSKNGVVKDQPSG